jgi:hypothetical protein
MLDGRHHGSSWRARCPVHGGDNPDSLHIWEDVDAYGYPRTALYCHAHQCSRSNLCAVMGIEVRDLYSMPANTYTTSRLPRGNSPRIAKLAQMEAPTPDEVIQVILEDEIIADPQWIETCTPAREKLWELAKSSAQAYTAFRKALHQSGLNTEAFWTQLRNEQENNNGRQETLPTEQSES